MKLKDLTLCAFGPFGKEVSLSFTELGEDGLFLLHGNTGSGKTTIFDAVCFALYGNASGENRGADSFRSDYAEEMEKTFVELTFSHQGEEYRIYRVPAYERKKKRGDGVTLSKAEAELYRNGQLLCSGYAPVTAEIVELLGIDWKQFKQLAMLAQGEFLRLLYADSVERAAILRRIFGTEHYEALQKNLKTHMLSKKAGCDDLEKRLLVLLTGIQTEETDEYSAKVREWMTEQNVYKIPELLETVTQLINLQRQIYEEKSAEKAEQQKKMQALSAKEALLLVAAKKREACEQYKKEQIVLQEQEKQLTVLEQVQKEKLRLCIEEEIRLQNELPRLDGVEEEQRNVLDEQKSLQEEQRRFTEWKKQADRLRKLQRQKTEKQEQFIRLYQKLEAAREDLQSAERSFLAEQAGILAQKLTEGMPCPVCGSLSHPKKAELSSDTVSEAAVNEKKRVAECAETESMAANTECHELKREYAVRTKAFFEEIKQTSHKALTIAETVTGTIPKSIELELDCTALETEEEWACLREQFIRYEKKLEEKQNFLQKKQQESNQRVLEKQKLVQAAEKNQKQKQDYQTELNQIEKKKLAKEEQIIGLTRMLREAEQELEEQTLEQEKEEALCMGKALLEQEQKKLEKELQTLYGRFSTNERVVQEVKMYYTSYEKGKKEYLAIAVLSKTANGELAGKARIPFEQYAQAFYFEQILLAANRQLTVMTNGQYELRRKKEASNLRSISGLELEVMDYYTGKIRGIRSLSGGESFQAALSLALGLSDVIEAFAGGIELGVLFLDEGFGTLDSQALDTAVTTLRKLAKGQRMVGIISHVEELKERIEKRVLVVKERTGSTVKKQ